jgi:hypothetical protein
MLYPVKIRTWIFAGSWPGIVAAQPYTKLANKQTIVFLISASLRLTVSPSEWRHKNQA